MKRICVFCIALITASLAFLSVSNAALVSPVPPVKTVKPSCGLNLDTEQKQALQWWISSAAPNAKIPFFSDPYCCSKPAESQERLDCLMKNNEMFLVYDHWLNDIFYKLSTAVSDKCYKMPGNPASCESPISPGASVPKQIAHLVDVFKCSISTAMGLSTTIDTMVKDLQYNCNPPDQPEAKPEQPKPPKDPLPQ